MINLESLPIIVCGFIVLARSLPGSILLGVYAFRHAVMTCITLLMRFGVNLDMFERAVQNILVNAIVRQLVMLLLGEVGNLLLSSAEKDEGAIMLTIVLLFQIAIIAIIEYDWKKSVDSKVAMEAWDLVKDRGYWNISIDPPEYISSETLIGVHAMVNRSQCRFTMMHEDITKHEFADTSYSTTYCKDGELTNDILRRMALCCRTNGISPAEFREATEDLGSIDVNSVEMMDYIPNTDNPLYTLFIAMWAHLDQPVHVVDVSSGTCNVWTVGMVNSGMTCISILIVDESNMRFCEWA